MNTTENAKPIGQHFSHRFTVPSWSWWCAAGIALFLDLVGNLVSIAAIPKVGQDYQAAGVVTMAMMGFYLVLMGFKVFIVLRRRKYAHKDLKLYLRWVGVHAVYIVLCLLGLFIVVLQIPAASQQAGTFFGSLSGGAHRYNMLITDAFLSVLSGALWTFHLVTVPRQVTDPTN